MFDKLKLLVTLLPLLTEMVKAVEKALPEKGQGAAKLALVREMLESVDDTLLDAWPLIERMISALVRMYNKIGLFAK